jgi:TPP-dependent pyruvate/acetoin dehydrogenase alpha subunit
MASAQELETIEREALSIVEAAVEFAEASPDPDASTVTEYVYG